MKYILIEVYPTQRVSILVSILPLTRCVFKHHVAQDPDQFVSPHQMPPIVGEISLLKWDNSSDCPSQETALGSISA